ncbi:hypothetical protein PSTG_18084, partial [Puccinia striiformis f. sp. tritici PST-78]
MARQLTQWSVATAAGGNRGWRHLHSRRFRRMGRRHCVQNVKTRCWTTRTRTRRAGGTRGCEASRARNAQRVGRATEKLINGVVSRHRRSSDTRCRHYARRDMRRTRAAQSANTWATTARGPTAKLGRAADNKSSRGVGADGQNSKREENNKTYIHDEF